MRFTTQLFLIFFISFTPCQTYSAIDTYAFSNDQVRLRFQKLTTDLRCPKCQNQNIADSNAEIAKDLRTKVFQMLEKGKSDKEIVQFMTDRYGDFVLYEPEFNSKTFVLWGGPVALLFFGLLIVVWISRLKYRTDENHSQMDSDVEREKLLQKILEENKD